MKNYQRHVIANHYYIYEYLNLQALFINSTYITLRLKIINELTYKMTNLAPYFYHSTDLTISDVVDAKLSKICYCYQYYINIIYEFNILRLYMISSLILI